MILARTSLLALFFPFLLVLPAEGVRLPAEGVRQVSAVFFESQAGPEHGAQDQRRGLDPEFLSFFGPSDEEKGALLGKALEAHNNQLWDEAVSLYRQVIALDSDDAEAWQGLGIALRHQETWGEAVDAGKQALALFTARGDDKGRGEVLYNLGNISEDRGHYDQAERLYREGLDVQREVGDEAGVAETLNNLGILAGIQERYVEAETLFQEKLEIQRKLGDEAGIAEDGVQPGSGRREGSTLRQGRSVLPGGPGD